MKRFLVSLFAGLVILLNLVTADIAQAQALVAAATTAAVAEQAQPEELIEQLKDKVLPQIESILTPEQRDKLEAAMIKPETSLRKAFKSIMLTPEQKTKLAAVFKSFPKKDFLTSMTPEQKKQFFMKKKEMFMPTQAEIDGYKAKK